MTASAQRGVVPARQPAAPPARRVARARVERVSAVQLVERAQAERVSAVQLPEGRPPGARLEAGQLGEAE